MLDRVTAAQALEGVIGALRAGRTLAEVLETLLGEARAMLEADEVYILLREGDRFRVRAGVGLPEGSEGKGVRIGEGLEGLAAGQRESVVATAAFRDSRFLDVLGQPGPVGAMVVYPLVLRDEVTGVIAATRAKAGRFGGADLWWLDLLGGLAATVVESDAVRRSHERRARQAEILAEVANRPGAARPSLFEQLTVALSRGLGADQVAVYLIDDEGALVCEASAGTIEPLVPPGSLLPADSPLARVYLEGEPFVSPDLSTSDGARGMPPGAFSAVAAPITVGGERRGVLCLAARLPNAFSPPDLAFLQVVAARVGMHVEAEELSDRRLALERERAEEDARQAFVGVISHELKTPVAVIQAYTDLLLRRAERSKNDANVDVLRRIGEQAERMLDLIDQLLDLQRLEGGMFDLERSRFDLAALARRVAEEAEVMARNEGVVVACYADPPKIPIVADRRRIEEVLENLLQNAVKYTRAGGQVAVRLRQESERAVVSVRDQGPGIALDEQARVFERFYQGRNRLHGGHVGLGLGLYISREVVRRHGGEIWLESIPGKGSTFFFSLPLRGPQTVEA